MKLVPTWTRAPISLSYLYPLRNRNSKSWKKFQHLRLCPLSIGFEYSLNQALFLLLRIHLHLDIARGRTLHGTKEADTLVIFWAEVGRVQVWGCLWLGISIEQLMSYEPACRIHLSGWAKVSRLVHLYVRRLVPCRCASSPAELVLGAWEGEACAAGSRTISLRTLLDHLAGIDFGVGRSVS